MKRQDPISLVILVVVLIPYLTDHQDSAKNSPSFFFALFLRKSIIFIFFTGPLGGGSSITKTQYCSFYRICQIHLQFFLLEVSRNPQAHAQKQSSQNGFAGQHYSAAKLSGALRVVAEWVEIDQWDRCSQWVSTTEHQSEARVSPVCEHWASTNRI